jgi:DNA-binding transcriptional LysR family regulator
MHIENLKVFADLVATKSFSKAAKFNGITQSAVSQQLRAMETHFNAPVLDRSQKRFQLTREGEVLYTAACEIMDIYSRADAEIKAMHGRIDGTIRLSTIHSIGLYELSGVLKDFLADYPRVNFRIEYRRNNAVLDDVAHNAFDFGLVAYPERTNEMEVIPFAEDHLVVICARNHALAARSEVSLADLAAHNFINYDHDIPTRKAVDGACTRKQVQLNTVMESDNVETIKRAVEVGVGIALVPSTTARQELAQGTLVALRLKDCVINRPLAIIHRKGFVLTPAMQLFIQMMTAQGGGATAYSYLAATAWSPKVLPF